MSGDRGVWCWWLCKNEEIMMMAQNVTHTHSGERLEGFTLQEWDTTGLRKCFQVNIIWNLCFFRILILCAGKLSGSIRGKKVFTEHLGKLRLNRLKTLKFIEMAQMIRKQRMWLMKINQKSILNDIHWLVRLPTEQPSHTHTVSAIILN